MVGAQHTQATEQHRHLGGAQGQLGRAVPCELRTGETVIRYEDRARRRVEVKAGKVVLASGAFNSPQLLQLSGIGNAAELAALGIPVVQDLPGVGEHLQDHMVAKIQHSATQPVTVITTDFGVRS